MRWALVVLGREAQERSFQDNMADRSSEQLLREVADQPLFEEMRKALPNLTWDAFKALRYGSTVESTQEKTRGRKRDLRVLAALLDNARLTILFKRYFNGEYRRLSKPSRLDILKARHGLTEAQADTVENYISKLA